MDKELRNFIFAIASMLLVFAACVAVALSDAPLLVVANFCVVGLFGLLIIMFVSCK